MPTRQPASFNAPFSRIAALGAAGLQLGGATREKALFILNHGLPRPRLSPLQSDGKAQIDETHGDRHLVSPLPPIVNRAVRL